MTFLKNIFKKQEVANFPPPSAEDLEKAKKIFFDNSCNHSVIGHEGYLYEYQKFHVSKEQENEWRAEYIVYWISQLSEEDIMPLVKLEFASAVESLPELFELAEKGDSYIKLSVATTIWSLINKPGVDKDLKKQATDVVAKIWNSIHNKDDVILTVHNRKEIIDNEMKYSKATTPEEYLVNLATIWAKKVKMR